MSAVRDPLRYRLARAAGALAGLLLLGATALAAQSSSETSLRQRIEASFEVFPVEGGVLLRPREGDGVTSVERREGRWAIDGAPADAATLRQRLGDEAEAVLVLGGYDGDELHRLFGFAAASAATGAGTDPASAGSEVGDEIDERRRDIEAEAAEAEARAEEIRASADEIRSSAEERIRSRDHRVVHSTDARVVFGSTVRVEADESSGEVVALGGAVIVDGEVMGGAVAIGGPVRVSGTVMGDVVSVGGGVTLLPTARVMGEVVSVGGRLDRAPGAEVMGGVTEVSLGNLVGPWNWGGRRWEHRPWFDGALTDLVSHLVRLVLVLLFGALVLALARGRVEGAAALVAREPLKSGLVGLVALVLFVPAVIVVTLLLTISIIGIPLVLLVPFAVVGFLLLAFVGYVAAAYALGRWAEARFGRSGVSAFLALLLGVVLLHAWTIMGDTVDVLDGPQDFAAPLVVALAFFGFVLKLGAWSVGLGGVLRGRLRPAPPAATAAGAPPPPPRTDSGVYWSEPRREIDAGEEDRGAPPDEPER